MNIVNCEGLSICDAVRRCEEHAFLLSAPSVKVTALELPPLLNHRLMQKRVLTASLKDGLRLYLAL